MDNSWQWQDGQFSYELVLDQNTLRYAKLLRHGGHVPTGPIGLAVSLHRRSEGKAQAGEVKGDLDLRAFGRVAIRRLPYRGYSAFRKPLIVIAGIACVIPFALWRRGKDGGVVDWVFILGPLLMGSFLMREFLARVFPHVALELVPKKGGRAVTIDLHGLPENQRENLARAMSRRPS